MGTFYQLHVNVFTTFESSLTASFIRLLLVNAFQATVIEGRLVGMNGVAIPYLYLGLFDGHGGAGCAIKVRRTLSSS